MTAVYRKQVKKHEMRRQGAFLRFARALAVLTLLAASLSACTCREAPKTPDAAPPIKTESVETPSERPPAGPVSARMRVVDLSGNPLPGMLPIATLEPNAFDKPVATGAATNVDGESRLQFPSGEKVYLRAWDPDLRYFPNNFYEALPDSGSVTEVLVVSMVQSGTLEALLMLPDGLPARGENTGLMLFHPVHGPWWPGEADANERGEVVFKHVPPGSYVVRIKVASGASLDVPETFIPPGESTHLGILYLQ